MPEMERRMDAEKREDKNLERLSQNPVHDAFDEEHETLYRHLEENGDLRKLQFANFVEFNGEEQILSVPNEEGEFEMAHSSATGDALVSNGYLGVDLIRVEEGSGFVPHTHPGDHILAPVQGRGTITYNGKVYSSDAGDIYIIEGEVPHAVGAITDHAIVAIGAPHAPIDSDERMEPVEYESVTTDLKDEDMVCLICEKEARSGERLHEKGCSHCPCYDCIGMGEEDE